MWVEASNVTGNTGGLGAAFASVSGIVPVGKGNVNQGWRASDRVEQSLTYVGHNQGQWRVFLSFLGCGGRTPDGFSASTFSRRRVCTECIRLRSVLMLLMC